MEELYTLLNLLVRSRKSRAEDLIAHGRALAQDLGLPCNPVGAGNMKTGTPGTYRPVGPSCPPCPVSDACYARYGPTRFHQERSSAKALPSLTAAVIAMIAAVKTKTLARLHIAGDVYEDGDIDLEYVVSLADLARRIRSHLAPEVRYIAWTYTHAPKNRFERLRRLLAISGISILYSERPEAGGAMIWPFNQLNELEKRHPRLTLVPCKAQLEQTTCRDCCLCFEAREKGRTIVFDPHGPKRMLIVGVHRPAPR